jgi:hypothetical protein
MKLVKIREDLYVPEDFEKNHNYYADPEGKQAYTGITSILGVIGKPMLIQWAANEAIKYIQANAAVNNEKQTTFYLATEELLEEARKAHAKKKTDAADHGTTAHAMVEDYINNCLTLSKGQPLEGNEKSKPIKKFIDWALENVDHFLFSERRMCNKELFVAGTADFACVLKNGKTVMGDFKTSSGVYGIDYFLQVAAYRYLAEAEGDASYDGSVIVRLGKDGSFEELYRYDYKTDLAAFLACHTLYRAQQTYKPKK